MTGCLGYDALFDSFNFLLPVCKMNDHVEEKIPRAKSSSLCLSTGPLSTVEITIFHMTCSMAGAGQFLKSSKIGSQHQAVIMTEELFSFPQHLASRNPTWRIIPGLGYVINNHGDRKSPKDRVVGPLPNGRTSWLINEGDPSYLLTGMILQVVFQSYLVRINKEKHPPWPLSSEWMIFWTAWDTQKTEWTARAKRKLVASRNPACQTARHEKKS